MRFARYIVWTVLFVTAFAVVIDCGGGGVLPGSNDGDVFRALDGMGIPKSDAGFKRSYTTAAGAKVRSVVDVPPAFLSAIDEGAQLAIDRRLPGWNAITSPSQVRVLIIEPSTFRDTQHPRYGQKCTNLETEPGAPCLLVNGVQTAGTVVGIQQLSAVDLKDSALVIPHQAGQSWAFRSYFVNTLWNETEHLLECVNEGRQGETCLRYQGPFDVHPHRP